MRLMKVVREEWVERGRKEGQTRVIGEVVKRRRKERKGKKKERKESRGCPVTQLKS